MNLIILLQIGIVGLLFIGLGIPLILRKVPPNHWYGFRLSKRVYEPDIWYPLNEYGGKLMVLIGAAMTGLGVGIYVVPGVQESVYIIAGPVILLLGVVVMTVLAYRRLRRL